MNDATLQDLLHRHYPTPGPVSRCKPLSGGRIHHSYQVHFDTGPDWLLQQFNTGVFTDPVTVMENIERVCAHINTRPGTNPDLGVPELITTTDGGTLARAAGDQTWRAFVFVANSRAFQRAPDPAHAGEAARAFATFVRRLDDLPEPPLHEILPGFHDTPARLRTLEQAAHEDPLGRLNGCEPLVRKMLNETELASELSGGLPLRHIHNDTKINNLLFRADAETPRVSHVVDLDTVMPGPLAHDFGDLVRSAANAAPDEDQAGFDLGLYAALARGYSEGMGASMTNDERSSLVIAPQVLSLELALRFLADHLRGDRYFRVEASGDNLRRAMAQYTLVRQMHAAEHDMVRILDDCGP
ncbi:MAG: phosphotransferase enzyme family protein [Gammaproteobacteria bacterium]